MRKLFIFILIIAIAVGMMAGCGPKQPPVPTEQTGTSPAQEQTQPTTQEVPATESTPTAESTPATESVPVIANKIGLQDTYWVASEWYSEETGETEVLQPELWALDLMIFVDGTARFRDIHQRVCLTDDSLLAMTWETTEEGEYLFYSKLYPQPVLRGTCEDGVLRLDYSGVTLTMNEKELPGEAGQNCTPAELTGTWLQVSGETEGYQWEVMPDQLSSLVFRVTAYTGPLELRADLEELDHYGEMTDAAHDQEVRILEEALYEGCGNNTWCVRIGPESAKDENGCPTETEVYATLLDYNTLLLQRYFTLDGNPAVSYGIYWRFPELVTWNAPEYMELGFTNWACTGYINAQGEDRSPPAEMENFNLLLEEDQKCTLYYGDGTMAQGTWQLANGGVVLVRNEEGTLWFAGAISSYYVETTYEITQVCQMWLYYNGGILKLQMTGYG